MIVIEDGLKKSAFPKFEEYPIVTCLGCSCKFRCENEEEAYAITYFSNFRTEHIVDRIVHFPATFLFNPECPQCGYYNPLAGVVIKSITNPRNENS